MKSVQILLALFMFLLAADCTGLVGFPDVPASLPDSGNGSLDSSIVETGHEATEASGDESGSFPVEESGSVESGSSVDAQLMPDGGLASDAAADGANRGCLAQESQVLATEISFTSGWPATQMGTAGTGVVKVLLLTNFTGTTALTGVSRMCGMTFPDFALNGTGQLATRGSTRTQIELSPLTWDRIARAFPVTGAQSGWNFGDSQRIGSWVSLFGLTSASAYAADTTVWPPDCANGNCLPGGSFAQIDLQDDDGDGKVAITAIPLQTDGYGAPATSVVNSQGAEEIYMAYRIELTVTQVRADCTLSSGTASLTLFDSHVVGCRVTSVDGGAGPCSSDQVQFLDANRAIYGYDQNIRDVASQSHPIMGTASSVALTVGAKCSDARTAFSPAFD